MPGARALCSRRAEPGHLTASLGVFWGLFPVHLGKIDWKSAVGPADGRPLDSSAAADPGDQLAAAASWRVVGLGGRLTLIRLVPARSQPHRPDRRQGPVRTSPLYHHRER